MYIGQIQVTFQLFGTCLNICLTNHSMAIMWTYAFAPMHGTNTDQCAQDIPGLELTPDWILEMKK